MNHSISSAPDNGKSGTQAATLRRGFRILSTLATIDEIERCCESVGQLSRALKVHKSQVSRSLAALAELDIVERCPDHRGYRLTWALYKLGVRGHRHQIVKAVAKPLEWLAKKVELSAYIAVRSANIVYPLWAVAPDDNTPISPPGQTWSLHASAAGIALLTVYEKEPFFEEFSEAQFEKFTATTLATTEQLWEKVERAKQNGYALQIGEWDPTLAAIATPIKDPFDNIAVAVSGKPENLASRELELAREIIAIASYLRRRLREVRKGQHLDDIPPRWLTRLSRAERHGKS